MIINYKRLIMSAYTEIRDRIWEGVEMGDCFFAFGKRQFEEAVKEKGLEESKILSAGQGLYGTKEGIENYVNRRIKQIEDLYAETRERCTSQEVYDYEFANHECGYICDDEEAIKRVIEVFGVTRTGNEVKRRFGYYDINAYADKNR